MKFSYIDRCDTLRRRSLLRSVLAGCAVMMASAAGATPPAPFAHGDPGSGQPLNEKDCVACHARRSDGDAHRIYTRSRLGSPAQLLAQVSYCNADLRTGYFPEEEEHIAAYLNKRYYRFE
jgi:cytochrome c2